MHKLCVSCCKIVAIFLLLSFSKAVFSQELKINDFVIFAGQKSSTLNNVTNPVSPGFSVNIGSAVKINGGHIGSFDLVNSTGRTKL